MDDSESDYENNIFYDEGNPEDFLETFKKYVDEGGDIDAIITVKDDSSEYYRPCTTLQRSIIFGHGEIMKCALDKGANISKEMCTGCGDTEMIKKNYQYFIRCWNALELAILKILPPNDPNYEFYNDPDGTLRYNHEKASQKIY